MFSTANDTIPLFRPRRGRDDRDASAGLMRNPNQINNARRRKTDAQGKRRVDGEVGYTQRREANALAPHGTTRNVRTPHTGATGTSHAKAGATTGASCAEAGSSSKLHEMNPRNSRATPHKWEQCAKHEHRPIQSESSARTASTAPPHPKKIKTLKRST